MPMMERLRRTREWSAMEIARHLPLRIRYWVTIQEVGRSVMTSPNVPETPLEEILKNLNRPKSMS